MSLTFAQVQHAWQIQDPSLVDKLCLLVAQPDPVPNYPLADDELTVDAFLDKIFSVAFRQQPAEVQFAERIGMIAKLEAKLAADDAGHSLPARYKIHIILTALWQDSENGSVYSRKILKQAIDNLPLTYGVWKGLKHIYKAAEYQQDYEMFGLIAAKIDFYRFDNSGKTPVSIATKTYMSLRAWRYLRTLGRQMPTAYVQAAVQVLASYDPDMTVSSLQRQHSWVLNHICFHNSLGYGVTRFHSRGKNKLFDNKGRAFYELWQRDYQPLMTLLATAKNENVRQFATDSLKHDFKTALRDVNVATIAYLSAGFAHSDARDELIVWLLEQSPNFEKAKFAALGLHEVVLKLLHSNDAAAYHYAIGYAKIYAKDLAVNELMFLALSEHAPVRTFAIEQFLARHPIKDIGLAGWGQLLDSEYHHAVASQQLAQHFAKKELTPAWFFQRLLSGNRYAIEFAITQLPNLYSAKELGSAYFISLAYVLGDVSGRHDFYNDYYEQHNHNKKAIHFALQQLSRLEVDKIATSQLQFLLLHPLTQETVVKWFYEDVVHVSQLPMPFLHALAYEPDWLKNDYIQRLKHSTTLQLLNADFKETDLSNTGLTGSDLPASVHAVSHWQQQLSFNDSLAGTVRIWLSDVRRFAPTDLGFEWLMSLAQSEHASYRDFAIDRINKGFLPADFVQFDTTSASDSQTAVAANPVHDNVYNDKNNTDNTDNTDNNNEQKNEPVDLNGQSFLFTGKMQSMTRGEAENLVKAANGAISSAVNGKLDYLVIGDEGSSLYGNGRKGSKQVKAEALIEKGAALKIISETAFLQRLTGQQRDVSTDDTLKGAETLWRMATADPQASVSELAISYLTHHHEQICLALTDRPVDPDATIPAEFFAAQRVIPLLSHANARLRQFALLLAQYELANWTPTPSLWVQMAQSPYQDVTDLLKRALLDKPSADNRRYHVSAEHYNEAMLQAFIASRQRFARQIGLTLLQRHPKFQDVETLYRLTQSTQREVRYAAVTMLWQHYKARHTSVNWTAHTIPIDTIQLTNAATVNSAASNTVNGNSNSNIHTITGTQTAPYLAQPQQLLTDLPADFHHLLMLLRRGLYEIPPGRLPGAKDSNSANAAAVFTNKDKAAPTSASATPTLKPISASRAKLALIETFRDVGLADKSFAAVTMPMLYAFTHSAGKMERHACLVAVTRLLHRYPELSSCLIDTANTITTITGVTEPNGQQTA